MTEKVLVGISQNAVEAKESQFSTEDVVPVFLKSQETVNILEKPIKIKKRDVSKGFILGNQNYAVLGTTLFGDNGITENLVAVIPVNDVYLDDLGEYSFVDLNNTTASVSAHRIDGNKDQEFVSDWIIYNSPKTYTQAKFDFSNLDHNLTFSGDVHTFPLSFPLDFSASADELYVSEDDVNWTLINTSDLTYNGSFKSLKFKIRFADDGKYISFIDPITKTLKNINVIFE